MMTPALKSLETALKERLPAHFVRSVRDPRQPGVLYPDEADAIARAVPARQVEFSAGREALRSCLRQLGYPEQSILIGTSRRPQLPASVVASLTHSAELCVALAAHASECAGIGVDLEPAKPLDDELRTTVLREDEQDADGLAAMRIFSAKEALYKAMSPGLGRVMDFQEVTCQFDPQNNERIEARLHQPAGRWAVGAVLHIASLIVADHILSLCILGVDLEANT